MKGTRSGPFDGEERRIEVGDLTVHAVDWGERHGWRNADPPPLLLLHSLGGSTVHWGLVGRALADRLHTPVTAVDLAGFGRTRSAGRPATLGANYDLVAGILAAEGPAVLVGNSMGGAIAIRVAARRPELVRGLVLVGPTLPQPLVPAAPQPLFALKYLPSLMPGIGPVLGAQYARLVSPEGVVDDQLNASLAHPERLDWSVRQRLIDLSRQRASYLDEAARDHSEAARSLFRYLGDPFGMTVDVRRVACPTFVVHGEDDRLVPVSSARAILRQRPDWRLEVLEDCGHLPQPEHPDRFVDLVAGGGTLDWRRP